MNHVHAELVAELLMRYLDSGYHPQSAKDTIFTVTSLFHEGWILHRQVGCTAAVDESLLCALADIATPAEACTFIWTALGMALPVDSFFSLFNRCLSDSSDLAVIHQAIGAGVDYCQVHHAGLAIPKAPIERLLASNDVDHRIVGLKAMLRSDFSLHSKLSYILAGLEGANCYERAGSLSVLLTLLDSIRGTATPSPDSCMRMKIARRLDEMSNAIDCPELVSAAGAARNDPALIGEGGKEDE